MRKCDSKQDLIFYIARLSQPQKLRAAKPGVSIKNESTVDKVSVAPPSCLRHFLAAGGTDCC